MTASQSIQDIFFEECEDLVDSLLEGLSQIADGDEDSETINAVFRAVHSIKGGAGAFGLNSLVSFAHTFETLLDQLRSGTRQIDASLTSTLQKSGDILSDLVDSARDNNDEMSDAAQAMLSNLEELLGSASPSEATAELDFEPLSFDMGLEIEPPSVRTHIIKLAPFKEFYMVGHDPLSLIKALEAIGTVEVSVNASELPGLDGFDPEEGYLDWTIELQSEAETEAVLEVFEFVEGACKLEVELLENPVPCVEGEVLAELQSEIEPAAEPEVEAPVAIEENVKEPKKEATEAPAKRGSRDTLRVDLERIDRLINLVGELIVNQAILSQRFDEFNGKDSPDVISDLDDYKQLARDIQEGVMSLRTQPVRPLFQRMSRIAREAADGVGKNVKLVTEGEWTEVDKKVTEKLSDPLTHMIRNSIDHGIEKPERRIELGKPEHGTVKLEASHKSGSVHIVVSDDGAGLNRERILEKAIDKGLVDSNATLSNSEIDELLFLPGFSTAESVTNLSGRGVGMDVVRNAISALGGRIAVSSNPGQGTTFSIQLPLTLAVLDGMLIGIGSQTLVVPISNILEAISPSATDIVEIEKGSMVLKNRDTLIPIIDLAKVLKLNAEKTDYEDRVLLVISSNSDLVALAVDSVRDQRQVVIKSLAGNYGHIDGISAATILGDGNVALIVDPDSLSDRSANSTIS